MLWASVNHVDKYLLSRLQHGEASPIGALFLISCFISIPFTILIALLIPGVFHVEILSMVLLIVNGALYSLAVLPYLIALNSEEASSVAPLFQLTPVVTYVLSILLLKEAITLNQLIGCFVITGSAIFLSTDFTDKIRLKTALLQRMAIVSLCMSVNAILYKWIAPDIPFIHTIFWQNIGAVIFGIIIFSFFGRYRKQFLKYIRRNSIPILSLNGLNEILTLTGNIAVYYASLLTPVALAWWVAEGFQPFFVFLFEIIIAKILVQKLEQKNIIKKSVCLGIMIIGAFLLK
jgi:uncharacterized membrane protein